jgi:GT2 family glycosyltransferase
VSRGGRRDDATTGALDPWVDVLIPTFERPDALAATLASLVGQTLRRFRVVVSDQGDDPAAIAAPVVRSVARVLAATGRPVELERHRPRRGMAEQRDHLLGLAGAPYALFLDDDVVCEGDLLERLLRAIRRAGCGFVGVGLVGPTFLDDIRPPQQAIDPWPGDHVEPERVRPGTPAWDRHRLHNAANLHHLRQRLDGALDDRLYRVAWIGGCVLYDVAKLRSVGGFSFWPDLPPEHAGEDVLAQLRVMERFGGAGLFPSGAYHLELPTTIPDRTVDAPYAIALDPGGAPLRPVAR